MNSTVSPTFSFLSLFFTSILYVSSYSWWFFFRHTKSDIRMTRPSPSSPTLPFPSASDRVPPLNFDPIARPIFPSDEEETTANFDGKFKPLILVTAFLPTFWRISDTNVVDCLGGQCRKFWFLWCMADVYFNLVFFPDLSIQMRRDTKAPVRLY